MKLTPQTIAVDRLASETPRGGVTPCLWERRYVPHAQSNAFTPKAHVGAFHQSQLLRMGPMGTRGVTTDPMCKWKLFNIHLHRLFFRECVPSYYIHKITHWRKNHFFAAKKN